MLKQYTRAEIKKMHIDKLQENYNRLQKDYKILKDNFESIIDIAIDVIFNDFNDDVELLARKLYKLGIIEKQDDIYIFPEKRTFLLIK